MVGRPLSNINLHLVKGKSRGVSAFFDPFCDLNGKQGSISPGMTKDHCVPDERPELSTVGLASQGRQAERVFLFFYFVCVQNNLVYFARKQADNLLGTAGSIMTANANGRELSESKGYGWSQGNVPPGGRCARKLAPLLGMLAHARHC